MVDPQREKIAVAEARRLEIPVIATGDTNVDPDMIDYIIPANDDAIRSIRLLCKMVADAAIEGMGQRQARTAEESPVGVDASDAEGASDEMIAKVAAGGTYSFAPEPDEDEAVLPGEDAPAEAPAADAAAAPAAEAPEAPVEPAEAPAADAPAEAPAAEEAAPEAAAEPAAAADDEKKDEASAEAKA